MIIIAPRFLNVNHFYLIFSMIFYFIDYEAASPYSTVTLLAKFRGLSTSKPRATLT